MSMLFREEIAKILEREIEFQPGSLVTITNVDISPDGYYAAVLISIISKEPKRVLEILGKNLYTIQQLLNRRMRIRPVPKIRFALDKAEFKREGVEKSLSQLKKKGEV